MTNTSIPQTWSVGIPPVDKEHQDLLDLLDSSKSESKSHFFNEFFDRFSALSLKREEHLMKVGYRNLKQIRERKNRTLLSLKQAYNEVPQNITGICHAVLMKEISDADLYYNSFPA